MRSVSMGAMARIASLFVVIAVCACFSSVGAAFADESKVELSEVSAISQAQVENAFEDELHDEKSQTVPADEQGVSAHDVESDLHPNVIGFAESGSMMLDTEAEIVLEDATDESENSVPPLEGGDYVIQTSFPGYVLDVAAGSTDDGANVQIYTYNATNAQKWRVELDADGYYTIMNLGSKKFLDLNGSEAVNGSNIQQYTANDTKAQKWAIIRQGAGFSIVSAINRDYVIDVTEANDADGTNVQLYTSNGTNAQVFIFAAFDAMNVKRETPIAEGDYLIQSGVGQFVLDVSGGSKSERANVQLYSYNDTGAQKWHVSYDLQGFYTFKNIQSGMVIDLDAAKAASGTNIQQYMPNGTAAQKWIITAKGSQYAIASAVDPLFAIDVVYASASNGANVQIYCENGTNAQLFTFIPLNISVSIDEGPADGVYVIAVAPNIDYAVDVTSCSLSDGANIQLYQGNETYAQRWGLFRNDDGFYTVFNLASGKVLDVANANPLIGANVQQYSSNDTKAQLWAIAGNDDGTYSFMNAISGLVLDVAGGRIANESNMQMSAFAGGATQKFVLLPRSAIEERPYMMLTTRGTNFAIDVPGGSLKDGQALQVYAANDTPAQHVVVRSVGDGSYTMQVVGSGRYLTDENGVVKQHSARFDSSQNWFVTLGKAGLVFTNASTGRSMAVSSAVVTNGTALVASLKNESNMFSLKPCDIVSRGLYTLSYAASSTARVVDVESCSWSNGANVQLYESNGTNAQKFVIDPQGDGYYRIMLALSGKAIDVTNGSTLSGGNVQIYTWNGTAAQLWSVVLEDGGLAFVNKGSGLRFEVAGGRDVNGANIVQSDETRNSASHWLLYATSVNLHDKESIARLVRSVPGSSSVTASFDVDSGSWNNLMDAVWTCWNSGYDVGFIMTDLQSGNYVALNADKTYYGASTMKGAYVTWIFEELLETGRISWSQVSDLATSAVEMSNNDSYHSLRNMFGDAEFNQWLNGVGLSGWGSARYTFYTPRELQLMWVRMLSYEQSGGNYVDTWRSIFNHSYYSQIYYELAPGKTTYTKPGWYPRTGNYGALADSGIVIGSDGRRYLLTIMSDINCYGSQWIERYIVSALDGAFNKSPQF